MESSNTIDIPLELLIAPLDLTDIGALVVCLAADKLNYIQQTYWQPLIDNHSPVLKNKGILTTVENGNLVIDIDELVDGFWNSDKIDDYGNTIYTRKAANNNWEHQLVTIVKDNKIKYRYVSSFDEQIFDSLEEARYWVAYIENR